MKIKGLLIAGILVLTCMTSAYALETGFGVGPGDVLEISVWKDESLSRQVVVPPDGMIAFPLIGDVNVRNMTVTEIRKNVTQRLKEYVQDAVVTVMLLEINSTKAYVIGKVNNPGVFPISMDTSVMQVLSMAGGLNPFAAESRIHVLRRQKDKTLKFPFDYKEVLKGENLNQNITLQRGDVVVVP
ncbi:MULTISPECIES: polysaccharide biosynthesis/export family protein [Desulfococcus]|uniref:Polysaccharide export protein n=1 Tax=Desulfococcus multivorans DSM 2059 TaxID=1121405 RepID=S7UPN7_DESML|nr:polysaccharide biosynthesis/export family protein [Desulfococcus multivorans]AOY60002.1 periplasmic polysaccharide export protein [Desulfococcus multivorans]AQV02146.1 sugar transporter [Desulfococcus multivorans]EPR35999.1 polysaccharide export protein [Desulfococcus multivorans DSM 2059]SJZ36579.1 polysaccharide export outer membrane protein [Desulfococcus multivorans DSM 2059]